MVIMSSMQEVISIHAPREGCDLLLIICLILFYNFNPRTPRGVRLISYAITQLMVQFQSTHPARGATRAFHQKS